MLTNVQSSCSTCLIALPQDFEIVLHQREKSLLGTVAPFESIRKRSIDAWKYAQELILDPKINCGLTPKEIYIQMSLIDRLGKVVEDLKVSDILTILDTEFSFLLDISPKTEDFAVPLQIIQHTIGGNSGQLLKFNRLTFIKNSNKQNYRDLLKYQGKHIYSLELKLFTDKPVNLY